jgi:hypothetical protein
MNESTYPQMSQILQLCQIRQFEVERIHESQPRKVKNRDRNPEEAHYDVVSKNHVVHNGGEDEGHQSKCSKGEHAEEPRDHLLLILLKIPK